MTKGIPSDRTTMVREMEEVASLRDIMHKIVLVAQEYNLEYPPIAAIKQPVQDRIDVLAKRIEMIQKEQ